ncbi:MAG: hypothetical protein GWN53_17060 [Gammaproteobacteria bacterium]|uniref:Uncharacterized protein n=1 Tax=Candidatus Kutchimonas denitrificans TaxID=3056748 RepID=A0AAE5CD73_9BACT|nr:hypothetical protein [Candidatus Kutchimonas denitrificans]NIV53551.1 hypothetical protein [Gammaproteobacteria bacterium]
MTHTLAFLAGYTFGCVCMLGVVLAVMGAEEEPDGWEKLMEDVEDAGEIGEAFRQQWEALSPYE